MPKNQTWFVTVRTKNSEVGKIRKEMSDRLAKNKM